MSDSERLTDEQLTDEVERWRIMYADAQEHIKELQASRAALLDEVKRLRAENAAMERNINEYRRALEEED